MNDTTQITAAGLRPVLEGLEDAVAQTISRAATISRMAAELTEELQTIRENMAEMMQATAPADDGIVGEITAALDGGDYDRASALFAELRAEAERINPDRAAEIRAKAQQDAAELLKMPLPDLARANIRKRYGLTMPEGSTYGDALRLHACVKSQEVQQEEPGEDDSIINTFCDLVDELRRQLEQRDAHIRLMADVTDALIDKLQDAAEQHEQS